VQSELLNTSQGALANKDELLVQNDKFCSLFGAVNVSTFFLITLANRQRHVDSESTCVDKKSQNVNGTLTGQKTRQRTLTKIVKTVDSR
jgi:hypothetical protein